MGSSLALLICSIGVLGLFFLNRDKSVRTSKALWLPVIWISIAGSRPFSSWFGIGGGGSNSLAASLDGSPLDATVYAVLLGIGLLVLLFRWKRTRLFLAANAALVAYFLYCLISVTWSPFHGPAFKRWTKDIGDAVMVLLVFTDAQPIATLSRLYTRIGFILFPFSVALIRYTDLGRGYDPDGNPMNTGVATNKNLLGVMVYVVSLGALWSLRSLMIHKDEPHRGRRMLAQGSLLIFGLILLEMAHSATAVACFVLGAGIMLATTLPAIRKRPSRVHWFCLFIVLGGSATFLSGGEAVVTHALGRNPDLTGRTEIWKAALAAADNPIIGTGYESFWNQNVGKVAQGLRTYWDVSNLVSAHNGYIEVYLDLGWIGVCLIVLILISGYRHASAAFQRDPDVGCLFIAYIATGAVYSVTETGFRVLGPSWIFLLLAVVGASVDLNFGSADVKPKIPASRVGKFARTPVADQRVLENKTTYASRRLWTRA